MESFQDMTPCHPTGSCGMQYCKLKARALHRLSATLRLYRPHQRLSATLLFFWGEWAAAAVFLSFRLEYAAVGRRANKGPTRRCSRFVCVLVAIIAIFAIYVRTSSIRIPATLVMGLVIVFPVMLVSASVIATVEVTYVRTYSASPFWSSFYEARIIIPFRTLSGKTFVISARRCVAVRRFGLRARKPVRIYQYRDWRSESECE